MRFLGTGKAVIRRESGITLLETVVALAILGTIVVIFLSGLLTTSKASFTTDERATAESLAQSQTEWVKKASYVYSATQYSPDTIPSSSDYNGYSVNITAEPLNTPDDGIQKIAITVTRFGEQMFTLEDYKVDR